MTIFYLELDGIVLPGSQGKSVLEVIKLQMLLGCGELKLHTRKPIPNLASIYSQDRPAV